MAMHLSWYKHKLGQKPNLISNFYKYDEKATFHHEFKNDARFSMVSKRGITYLEIKKLQLSDSATYYCGSAHSNIMEFGEGTELIVQASQLHSLSVLQYPIRQLAHTGASVTLNCTVITDRCPGDHSVYWFRHNSGESKPGIIYTHGDRNDLCRTNPKTGSRPQTCVYSLPKMNLSLSDAGTYYCAVVVCGQILIGNGTQLDMNSADFSYSEEEAWQEPLKTAEVGGRVNLVCVCTQQRITTIIWFRQKLGEKPYVIGTSYQQQPAKFYNEFEGNDRFDAKIGPYAFNLSISNIEVSDSATYYCAVTFLYDISFGQGTVLIVKDQSLKNRTHIQLENIPMAEPGDSVIQCTVVADRCAANHSVYWYRNGLGKSPSGIIYTEEQSSGQCKESSSTQTCVFSLPKSLSTSDAGTYYCAVAACGEILFANETKLNIEDTHFEIEILVLLSIIRSAVLLFTFAVCLFCIHKCH
ncbi:putative immune-type receptor 4 precursor [Clarias magur]|uniref:Putative immune-type receptor 4 n=1 Tax=Clarias magur TaxID=1594786 RepID=A0A8J4TZL4_CLAMG|nr:putative immune-type receptor 4 precursor [Clarias magur]